MPEDLVQEPKTYAELLKKNTNGKKNPFYLNKIIPLSVDTIGAQNRTQLLWERFTATFTFLQKH